MTTVSEIFAGKRGAKRSSHEKKTTPTNHKWAGYHHAITFSYFFPLPVDRKQMSTVFFCDGNKTGFWYGWMVRTRTWKIGWITSINFLPLIHAIQYAYERNCSFFCCFLRTWYRKRAHSIQSPSSNGKKSWSEVKTWPKNDPAGRIYGWYRAGWLHIFTWPVCQCVCVCVAGMASGGGGPTVKRGENAERVLSEKTREKTWRLRNDRAPVGQHRQQATDTQVSAVFFVNWTTWVPHAVRVVSPSNRPARWSIERNSLTSCSTTSINVDRLFCFVFRSISKD